MSCECDHSVLEVWNNDIIEQDVVRAPCVVEIVGVGPQGPKGPPGSGEGFYTETWKWTSSLVDASASGKVGINQTTWGAATQVNVNELAVDGRDMTLAFAALFTVGNKILLQKEDDATRYGVYLITGAPTDHGTWWSFPVTILVGAGLIPSNNNETVVTIFVTGGSGSLPNTTDLLAGDGSGGAVDSGIAPANVVVKHPTFPTPTTLNQVIACLQNAGLCV